MGWDGMGWDGWDGIVWFGLGSAAAAEIIVFVKCCILKKGTNEIQCSNNNNYQSILFLFFFIVNPLLSSTLGDKTIMDANLSWTCISTLGNLCVVRMSSSQLYSSRW